MTTPDVNFKAWVVGADGALTPYEPTPRVSHDALVGYRLVAATGLDDVNVAFNTHYGELCVLSSAEHILCRPDFRSWLGKPFVLIGYGLARFFFWFARMLAGEAPDWDLQSQLSPGQKLFGVGK